MESTTNTPTFFSIVMSCFCFIIIEANVVLSSSSNSINNPFPKEAHPTKSGYLPVSTNSSSAIFYTFYEAQNSTISLSQTPLLIWLQGGQGSSSMLGNFYEVGPWLIITESLTLQPNPAAWNRIFGILFLDNPIGTGFSVASSPNEIPTDQKGVAKQLFASITRFLQLDPVFKHRPIYLIGESYGGKYVTSLGYYILKENSRLSDSERVNLVGVAIGDGAIEPVIQAATSADSAYYVGLINEKQKRELEKLQLEAVRLAQIRNWKEAADTVKRVWNKLQDMSGLSSMADYTMIKDTFSFEYDWIAQFLNKAEVKKALGVNESQVFNFRNDDVHAALSEDLEKSVKPMVEHLLRSSAIKVLLYEGQYDLLGGPVQVEAWVKTMEWEGIEDYLNAERKIWKVNGELAGYVQKWKSFTNVVVLGGGHILPPYQRLNTQVMIQDWVLERGIFGNSPSLGYI